MSVGAYKFPEDTFEDPDIEEMLMAKGIIVNKSHDIQSMMEQEIGSAATHIVPPSKYNINDSKIGNGKSLRDKNIQMSQSDIKLRSESIIGSTS